MKINGNDIYTGAYARRQEQAHETDIRLSSEQTDNLDKSIENAFGSIAASNGNVNVSVSKEIEIGRASCRERV